MNKGFGLIGILIGVAVIAVITYGGFYYSNSTNQVIDDNNGIENIINKAEDVKDKLEENNKEISDNLNETADWKTFKEKIYNFEIKFPVEQTLTVYDPYEGSTNDDPYLRVFQDDKLKVNFTIGVSKEYGLLGIRSISCVDNIEGDDGAKLSGTTLLGGETAYMFNSNAGVAHGESTRPYVYIQRCYNNLLYKITFPNTQTISGDNKLIIGSFKFVKPKSD